MRLCIFNRCPFELGSGSESAADIVGSFKGLGPHKYMIQVYGCCKEVVRFETWVGQDWGVWDQGKERASALEGWGSLSGLVAAARRVGKVLCKGAAHPHPWRPCIGRGGS